MGKINALARGAIKMKINKTIKKLRRLGASQIQSNLGKKGVTVQCMVKDTVISTCVCHKNYKKSLAELLILTTNYVNHLSKNNT